MLYKRLITFLVAAILLSGWASTAVFARKGDFADARWIALEADSTILFPHIHLLKAKSKEGQSLKPYRLPVFTKPFTLERQAVSKATAYVCGLGQYELFINGQKVGRHFLDPGWTMYNKRLLYNEHDVTEMLQSPLSSPVNISVMLGGGMYDIPLQGYHKFAGSCGAPKMLFALHIVYQDGHRQIIVSDGSWLASESPVTYSSIYGGEYYDATFNAKPTPVVVTRPQWDVPMERQDDHTRLVVRQELPMTLIPGTNIYDMRQNCSGIVRLTVRGRRGSKVTLRPAEILKDGVVYQRCMPNYTWSYTLRGDADGET